MPHRYDNIVIGVGGVGAAALYHLARRGQHVLGIDRFAPGHDRGSSHGATRMFRMAYFEGAGYVPLLRRARELWNELATITGQPLYRETGLLEVGVPGGPVLGGVLASARRHGLPVEELDAPAVSERWPGLRVPDGQTAVFEQEAGVLAVEACVEAHARLAVEFGAELQVGDAVTNIAADRDDVVVTTASGEFHARGAVVTAGAWAAGLLADLRIPLRVHRQAMFWFATDDAGYTFERGFPGFFFEDPDATPGAGHYGFPALDPRGVKVARHHGGRFVTEPSTVDRQLDQAEQADATAFLHRCLPGVSSHLTDHAVCLYTNTPDEHFVVDAHPRLPQIAFAAGLSGHGFKFATVLGEALAELAIDGTTDHPIDFLRLDRPALH